MENPLVLGLKGPQQRQEEMPELCVNCGSHHFYKQTDFNRNLGLFIVGIAALATFVLAIRGHSWWVTWSPMPLALVADFSLSKSRPLAALCYKCGLIYRGVGPKDLSQLGDFDLELYDLIKYPERTRVDSNAE